MVDQFLKHYIHMISYYCFTENPKKIEISAVFFVTTLLVIIQTKLYRNTKSVPVSSLCLFGFIGPLISRSATSSATMCKKLLQKRADITVRAY